MQTKTDHRLVITTISGKLPRPIYNKQLPPIDINKLKLLDFAESFKSGLYTELESLDLTENVQDKWNNITKHIIETATEVLGHITPNKRSANPKIVELSRKQRQLQTYFKMSSKNNTKCKELKIERNKIQKQIKQILELKKYDTIIKQTEEINKSSNESAKITLLVDTGSGLTTNIEEQTKIIADFFKDVFNKPAGQVLLQAPPCKMSTPFTEKEVRKAISKLKLNKAAGIDNI
ncbi:hypothetical protein A3Q56_06922 [Intoshia linei]|uniref:Uncharacterized protein n=1 Tax=Intoshia linei TaxID=1819745 RepID=A0A177AVC7_9BILA|nr:hypothetical protein A3Q56_06922 [Intoshia linei]